MQDSREALMEQAAQNSDTRKLSSDKQELCRSEQTGACSSTPLRQTQKRFVHDIVDIDKSYRTACQRQRRII